MQHNFATTHIRQGSHPRAQRIGQSNASEASRQLGEGREVVDKVQKEVVDWQLTNPHRVEATKACRRSSNARLHG